MQVQAQEPHGGTGVPEEAQTVFFDVSQPPFAVYGLLRDAGLTDVSLKLYPEGRHEMHNELNKEEVFSDLITWCEAHL